MKLKKTFIFILLVSFLLQCKVNAFCESSIKEYTNGLVREIEGYASEENSILAEATKDIEIDGSLYSTQSIERIESEDNAMFIETQLSKELNTTNESEIINLFGETYNYEDDVYKGTLKIENIETQEIEQGSYQELLEKKINFNGYTKNDLNEIEKERMINNKKYYLITVDWQVEEYEIIDEQKVPISYKGIMIYQTVITKKNPSKYNIIVTYSGDVNRKDKKYMYKVLYTPVIEPTIEEKNFSISPIVISGLGVGIIFLIVCLNRKNIKIYNKTETGYKLLGNFKISSDKKVIDISKYQYKVNSNMYSLKFNKITYEKLKNNTIFIQIGKFKKQIYVNAPYIEFII